MLWLGQEKEQKAADAESALKIQSHTPPCTCTLSPQQPEREKPCPDSRWANDRNRPPGSERADTVQKDFANSPLFTRSASASVELFASMSMRWALVKD